MRRSLNEIETTLRKAATGAGLPHGLALEIGWAAGWLAQRAADPCASVLRALAAPAGPCPGLGPGGELPDMRIAWAGPTAVDLLAAGAPDLHMPGADAPLLLMGMIGARKGLSGAELRLADGRIWRISPAGIEGAALPDAFGALCLSAWPGRGGTGAGGDTGVLVDAEAWAALGALAHKTLVPENEESRLRGAGAGLTDND